MKVRVIAGLVLYVMGAVWNLYLFKLGGFWGDWITLGRWAVCIGDLCYLFGFAVALSIPFRYKEIGF